MKSHRIFITSAGIFTLLLCITSLSEGRSFYSFDKIFDEPLYHEWLSHFQGSLVIQFSDRLKDEEDSNYRLFYNSLFDASSYVEISYIHEKKCVVSRGLRYTGSSQRPPPLFSSDKLLN